MPASRLARRGAVAMMLPALLGAGATVTPAAAQPAAPGPRAERLERLAELIQRRLALTDEQAARLRATSARFGRERQRVVAAERDARMTLRAEVPRGADADQPRLRAALDALVAAQQRRAALLADEQRELSAFLTPVQRAQYLGLQERALRAAGRVRGGGPGGRGFEGGPRARPF